MSSPRTPDPPGIGVITEILKDVGRRLATLEAPTGTSVRSLVEQVKTALANIRTTVRETIAELSYTRDQINDRIASTPGSVTVNGNHEVNGSQHVDGNIVGDGSISSGGDVAATGFGTFPAGVRSVGAYSYVAGANRFTMWIDPSGQMGTAPSSHRFKTDIETWEIDVSQLLQLRGVLFRYDPDMFPGQWMDPDAPKEFGFIAEELLELGFPMLVIFDADGLPSGIAYERMVVVLLMLAQWEHTRVTDLEERVNALEA